MTEPSRPSDKSRRRIGVNARLRIDRILQQTPCICGATDTWHQTCYAGKSEDQVAAAYDRVYTRLARVLRNRRASMAKATIELARLG